MSYINSKWAYLPGSRGIFWWRQKQWWQQDWNGHQRCDRQCKPTPSEPDPKQLLSQEMLSCCSSSRSPPMKHTLQISGNMFPPPQLPTASINKQNHDIIISIPLSIFLVQCDQQNSFYPLESKTSTCTITNASC